MKKINKLVISPEKIMKTEELINLQGGSYGSMCCQCGGDGWNVGYMLTATPSTCDSLCKEAYYHMFPDIEGDWQC